MAGRKALVREPLTTEQKEVAVENNMTYDEVRSETTVAKTTEEIVAEALAKQAEEFQKMLAMALASQTSTVAPVVQNEVHENEVKFIPDNTKIEIKSNVVGTFHLKDEVTVPTVNVTFAQFGNRAWITYEQLRNLWNKKPIILTGGMVALSRVASENKNITMQDIYHDLDIGGLYKNHEINPLNFDDLISEKTDANKFDALVRENMCFYDMILDLAYLRYSEGKFNNNTKMNTLRTISKNDNLFR